MPLAALVVSDDENGLVFADSGIHCNEIPCINLGEACTMCVQGSPHPCTDTSVNYMRERDHFTMASLRCQMTQGQPRIGSVFESSDPHLEVDASEVWTLANNATLWVVVGEILIERGRDVLRVAARCEIKRRCASRLGILNILSHHHDH